MKEIEKNQGETKKVHFAVPEMPDTIKIDIPKGLTHGEITIYPDQTSYDSKGSHKKDGVKDGKVASIKRRQMRRDHPSGKQKRRK